MLWLCAACLVLLRASDCESICYVRIWLSCAVPYMLCELVLSSCHESCVIWAVSKGSSLRVCFRLNNNKVSTPGGLEFCLQQWPSSLMTSYIADHLQCQSSTLLHCQPSLLLIFYFANLCIDDLLRCPPSALAMFYIADLPHCRSLHLWPLHCRPTLLIFDIAKLSLW